MMEGILRKYEGRENAKQRAVPITKRRRIKHMKCMINSLRETWKQIRYSQVALMTSNERY